MLEATTYTRIYGQQQLFIVKIIAVKLYSRKIFSYVFCVRKYIYNEKKSELQYIYIYNYTHAVVVNYGIYIYIYTRSCGELRYIYIYIYTHAVVVYQ